MEFAQELIVVLDTSSDMLCCGLAKLSLDGDNRSYTMIDHADHMCRRRANEELCLTIQDLLERNGYSHEDMAGVLVGRGPGSFTGVRIGVATAKGLAAGAGIPLFGASTLDASAFSAWKSGVRGRLAVVADAMRKEVYPGIYELNDNGIERLFTHETVVKTDACITMFLDEYPEGNITLTGDGLIKYKSIFEDAGFTSFASDDVWFPESEGLLYSFCTPSMDYSEAIGDPAIVLPVYTRLSDAEETERQKLGLENSPTSQITGCADELADIHLQLRPMAVYDIEKVATLEASVFADLNHSPWSENMFKEDFAADGHIWWVAHDMGEIVGYAGGVVIGDTCEVLNVATEPSRRGEGIASRLLARLAYDAQMLNCKEITLEVEAGNDVARSLYATLGFKEVGRRPSYYAQGIDAIIMTAKLPLKLAKHDLKSEPQPQATGRTWPLVYPERSTEDAAKLAGQGDLILAIESSCDETAMAIINETGEILSSVVATQIDFHARFGGVVPEIASRKHTEALVGVYEETLEEAARTLGISYLEASDLSCVAVTQGPGLVGALVVGIAFAKGICTVADIPLLGINHLEGHLAANLFETPDLEPPFISSLVSGGNTMLVHVKDWGDYEILGATIDDAVGEAFDKVAKALGLGYPGGPIISKLAEQGNPKAIRFPRAMMHSKDYSFSLSGLKTSVITYLNNEQKAGRTVNLHDLAASFEAAVIDVQVAKAKTAVLETQTHDFCAGGGVTANPSLRKAYRETFEPMGVRVTVPPMGVCTDNAAMIALVALRHYKQGRRGDLSMDANPSLQLEKKADEIEE